MIGKKGFTLIELLVVIAIIGILSSVILASLNAARDKGADAKTKSQLSGLRGATEIYHDNTGHYGTVATDNCTDTPPDFFEDPVIIQYTDPNNYPAAATLSCHTDTSAWAVSALLIGTPGEAWCVDSTGVSKQLPTGNLGVGEVVCP